MNAFEIVFSIVAVIFMCVVLASEYMLWSAINDMMKEFGKLDKAFNVHRHPGRRQGDK